MSHKFSIFCFIAVINLISCGIQESKTDPIGNCMSFILKQLTCQDLRHTLNFDDKCTASVATKTIGDLTPFDQVSFKEIDYEEFIIQSSKYNKELKLKLKNDRIDFNLVPVDSIFTKGILSFNETYHFRQLELNNNYTSGLYFSNPRFITNGDTITAIIQLNQFLEFPMREKYYLVKIINNEFDITQLKPSIKKALIH